MIIETDFYKLTAYRNLIHMEAFSSWDERILKQVLKDLEYISITLFAGKEWAVLNNSENWELLTPETENMAETYLEKGALIGHTHNAVVVGNSAIKEWQTQNVFNDISQFETRIFETQEEALSWLASFGYTMAPISKK